LEQRLRRQRARLARVNHHSGTEAVVEAFLHTQHPLIIGLVSQLIGSTDRSQVEAFIRRAWTVGHNILGGASEQNSVVPPLKGGK
jgi:hypothetical protein